jgi:hypothetical protein
VDPICHVRTAPCGKGVAGLCGRASGGNLGPSAGKGRWAGLVFWPSAQAFLSFPLFFSFFWFIFFFSLFLF